MSILGASALFPVDDLVSDTRFSEAPDISLTAASAEASRIAWENIIDYKLVEWGRDPSILEEDDLIPPTGEAIDVSIEVAMQLLKNGNPPPMRVVPDRDGGVVFERWSGPLTVSIIVSRTGSVEVLLWNGSRIVKSEQLG